MLFARKYRSFSVGFLNVPCGCNRCFAFSQRTPSRCYQSCFIIRFADCAKHKRPGSFKLRVFRRDTYVSHTLQDRFIDSKDQIFEIGEVSDAIAGPGMLRILGKANLGPRRGRWLGRRIKNVHEFLKDVDNRDLMCVETSGELFFQGGELLRELARTEKSFPHFDEGADDEDAHLHGPRAVEDVCGLEGSVLGKGVGPIFAVLATPEL